MYCVWCGRRRAQMMAGFELGGYLFLGATAQLIGLRYTSAIRGAFIVQLTTVLVPLLEGIKRRRLPDRWARCPGSCALPLPGYDVRAMCAATKRELPRGQARAPPRVTRGSSETTRPLCHVAAGRSRDQAAVAARRDDDAVRERREARAPRYSPRYSPR